MARDEPEGPRRDRVATARDDDTSEALERGSTPRPVRVGKERMTRLPGPVRGERLASVVAVCSTPPSSSGVRVILSALNILAYGAWASCANERVSG